MEIPEKWRELLASVRSVFPTAIIAGGAMRDLENGKPVKDIDINVEANGQTFTSIKASVHRLFPGLILVSNNGSYCPGWQEECLGYITLLWGGLEVQIVPVTTTPKGLLERLDFGICQIGFDGTDVIRTPAYVRDRDNQTFTLIRCDNADQKERSRQRFERLSVKYPGWSFVDTRLISEKHAGWDYQPYEASQLL